MLSSCGVNARLEGKRLGQRYHSEVEVWFAMSGCPWTGSYSSEFGHGKELMRVVLGGSWHRRCEYERSWTTLIVEDHSPAIWNDLFLLALRSP